ncbi:hypothetical protein GCM10027040_28510 [Halomonas shantousis]
MAPRPDNTRLGPIVPEREDGTQPPRYMKMEYAGAPRKPRVWPLWGLTLLLMVGMIAGGYYYWQQRHAWQARFESMNAQVESLQERVAATDDILNASGASLRDELDRLRQDLEASQAVIGSLDQRVAEDRRLRPEALRASIDALEKADETRQATLASLSDSLQALERLGEERRTILAERLEGLAANQADQAEQLETLADRQASLTSLRGELETLQTAFDRLMDRADTLEEQAAGRASRLEEMASRQESLAARIETLEASPGDSTDIASLDSSVQQLEGSLRELRQAQIAMSASLESLRSRMESLTQGASSQELRDLKTRMESLETSRAQLTRRVTSLMSDVASLQRQAGNG